MAGTADNFVAEKVLIGPGKMYVDLGGAAGAWDGAAGVRLILDTDGKPDTGQNPNGIHLGYTEGGTEWLVKPTLFFLTTHGLASGIRELVKLTTAIARELPSRSPTSWQ